MSSTANAESNTNPWSRSSPVPSNTNEPATQRARAATATKHVPDAWDDDEDETEIDNATLWRDANAKPPMPEVIISASSGAPPPAALQQPVRILKRPSATSSPSSSSQSGGNGPSSMKDREAAYQAARARIFGINSADGHIEEDSGGVGGGSGDAAVGNGLKTGEGTPDLQVTQMRLKSASPASNMNPKPSSPPPTPTPGVSVSVLRNPRGPSSSSSSINENSNSTTSNANPKGFGRRRGGGGKARGGSGPTGTKP